MFQLLKKRLKNQKGLSLVELLAVIVILGIVSAIAVPSIGNIIENSRYSAVKADAINVLNAAQLYYLENPTATADVKVSELKTANYLESSGKIPDDSTISTTKPHTLNASVVEAVDSKTIKISANMDQINADTQKGSDGVTAIPKPSN